MDRYDGIPTGTLVGICYRVTPQREAGDWRVTNGQGAWCLHKTGEFVKYNNGRLVDARSAEIMRRDVTEQLAFYKVTTHQINMMKS